MILWAGGILTGFIWSGVNYFFILKLLEAFLIEKSAPKTLAMIAIKFPVLYLAGFFILKFGFFPVFGILSGCLAGLIAAGVFNYARSRRA
ncbi:MAG: hypothetical protein HQL30_10135 [Candidatus Omnitrophica bacterium]|nr:hypothetical protein [Candidatus Omnitrophota bacterium]